MTRKAARASQRRIMRALAEFDRSGLDPAELSFVLIGVFMRTVQAVTPEGRKEWAHDLLSGLQMLGQDPNDEGAVSRCLDAMEQLGRARVQ